MLESNDETRAIDEDIRRLHQLGYAQELLRRMNGFSNLALSMSIICILAGGITSFHLGFCSVGGAAIGLGWPVACLFSLVVALTMAQVASAFPTAGGLYHWAAILGGKGWGWATAWFNLAGLVTVLAAINVGAWEFFAGAFLPDRVEDVAWKLVAVTLITGSQAVINHLGIRLTTLLTDFSGYWILIVAAVLTGLLLAASSTWDIGRWLTFSNFSGLPEAQPVWPATANVGGLFLLGMLLPAYTITGFDASAHAAEETIDAARNVPRGIVRSVLVSGIAGWVMLLAVVLAMPDMNQAAQQGPQAFLWTLRRTLSPRLVAALCGGIVVAQYLCGLATVTSASRVAYAFARDGGLPASWLWRRVSPQFRTPAPAIWLVAIAAALFTVYTPVYSTITAVCTIFLYVSYVVPAALGLRAYGGAWTQMGPWNLGGWYRPLAAVSVVGCLGLIVIGMQPPNDQAQWVVGGAVLVLAAVWFTRGRWTFAGPPIGVVSLQRQREIIAAEDVVHQSHGDAP